MKQFLLNFILFPIKLVLFVFERKTKISAKESIDFFTKTKKKPSFEVEITNDFFANKSVVYDLSIIVPCFNVEKFLPELLNCLFSQVTKFNVEIIFVDDCSTDGTSTILGKISKYNNIKIITNRVNSGLAYSRNVGIDNSSGKYIMFLDADDLISKYAIETFLSAALENPYSDIVIGNYQSFSDDLDLSILDKPIGKIKKQKLHNSNDFYKLPGYAWGRIYKREMFNSVRFFNYLIFEDTINHMVLYSLAREIILLDCCLYFYRLNNTNSIMHTYKTGNKRADTIYIVEACYTLRKKMHLNASFCDFLFFIRQLSIYNFKRTHHLGFRKNNYIFRYVANLYEIYYKNSEKYVAELKTFSNDWFICKSFSTKKYFLWLICCLQ